MSQIDLNCDMGESFGAWKMGADQAVMPWVTSANIACGFHAGDPSIMRITVKAALEAGVAVGAHVGLPDLAGFGRRAMSISAQQAYDLCIVQIGALQAVAATFDAKLAHMKPHGALYHMAEQQPEVAQALARAVRDMGGSMRLVGLSGGGLLKAGQDMGVPVVHEVFADRRYQSDGRLVPRGEEGAVIESLEDIAEHALALALHNHAITAEGRILDLRADSVCIHGDRDHAADIARTVHQRLRKAGVRLAAVE
jgi:UPF0271 protein